MTYEERMKQVCDTCDNHKNTCGYRCRGLNDKCEYLQTIMEGWELGKEDTINKACEWLKSYRQETSDGTGYISGIVNDETIEDFRKAMEDCV